MTTTFFLIRHAAHDQVGDVLCGRMPGVALSDGGRRQAEALAQRLSREPIVSVYTSPVERASETARPIADALGVSLVVDERISEIDVGAWAGQRFDALEGNPLWHVWNRARSVARPPSGETMLEVQARIVEAMERLRQAHSGGTVALVSHADVIKAALLYHLGLSVDAHDRIEISPASISTIVVGDWGAKLLHLNEVTAL
ncbi:histidine phosphatase family protein [Microvirga thermotolerans]|uniref:Histidine phosphatase family protein n=1 Tax=Microvirga thermotolerans TaxID=2651334 RepID=A0A5P9K131_9HYPH|nr:histidine phosphatase family protein [Microvirga thermotolerans]QFU17626.1 histidine phosphatase family protein [Microvirga thermotolerans]